MTRKEMYKQCFEIFQTQFKELMKADEEEKALVLKFNNPNFISKYQRKYYDQKRADAFKEFYEPYISKIQKRGDMLIELLENIKQDYLKDTVDLSDPRIQTAVAIATNNGFASEELFADTNEQVITPFIGNIPVLRMLKTMTINTAKRGEYSGIFEKYIFDPELEFEVLKMNITSKFRTYLPNVPADLKWNVRKYAKMLENLAVKSGIGLTEKEMRVIDDELGFTFLQGFSENYSDLREQRTASIAAEIRDFFDSEGAAETGEAAEGAAE